MIDLNKTIHWQPQEIGTGRFGNWLEEVKDWSLSRDRYWGTPLPIWISEDKEDMFAVGSIEELSKGEYECPDGSIVPVPEAPLPLDLHRPFVDNVIFRKMAKCIVEQPKSLMFGLILDVFLLHNFIIHLKM